MSLEAIVSKYLASTEKVLCEMQRVQGAITVSEQKADEILEYVSAYLADAKYYKGQKRFETSLASVAYCEGLLDALRLLGAVKFEWPRKTGSEE